MENQQTPQALQMPQQEQPKKKHGCLKIGCLTGICLAGLIVFVSCLGASKNGNSSSTSSETPDTSSAEPSANADEYKKQCMAVSYDEIARDANGMKSALVTFSGEIIQATDDTYRLRVEDNIDNVVLFQYHLSDDEERVLEGDTVTIWGVSKGLYTYKTVLGNKITVPRIDVKYLEIGTSAAQLDTIELNQNLSIENWNINVVSVSREKNASQDALYFIIEATNSSEEEQYLHLQEGYCDGFKIEAAYEFDDFNGEKNLSIESVSAGRGIRGYAAFNVNSDWNEFELKINDSSFVVNKELFSSEENEE